MAWFSVTENRQLEPEVMDDPALAADRHRHALRGLSRLNGLSGSVRIVWDPIVRLRHRENRPLRILDLATGAGDIPMGLWHRARRAGMRVDIHAVDISPFAVQSAQRRAAAVGAAVRFREMNVLVEPLPVDFDVVICSLFLHHLNATQATELLAKMRQAARSLVLVNDLVRGFRGLMLAHAAARLFTASDVVHTDAPRSVRAAFTLGEVRRLARQAALQDAHISRRWPFRFLLMWRRP